MQLSAKSGFTIIEVMIYLAVSGILLSSAYVLITGRQNYSEFILGIRQIASNIRTDISNVSLGYYPSLDLKCQPKSGGGITITSTTTPSQGTNNGCQYIGEAIQFDPNNQPDEYNVYTVAGAEFQGSNNTLVTNLSNSYPLAVPNSVSNSIQTVTLPYGIHLYSINSNILTQCNSVSQAYLCPYMFGVYSLTGASSAVNGSGSVDLVPYCDNKSINENTAESYIDSIDNNPNGVCPATDYPPSSDYNPASGIVYCFDSSTTNQSGVITIGAGGNPNLVNLTIHSYPCS